MPKSILILTLLLSVTVTGWSQPSQLQIQAQATQPVSVLSTTTIGSQGFQNIYYWVIARTPSGYTSPTIAVATGTVGISSLSGTNYVRLSWSPVTTATGYDLIRSTDANYPASTSCLSCAIVLNTSSLTFNDQGGATNAYPPAGAVGTVNSDATINIDNATEQYPYLNVQMQNNRYNYTTRLSGGRNMLIPCTTNTGTNTYVCNGSAQTPPSPPVASLTGAKWVGLTTQFKPNATNTGASTLNNDGLGAVAIQKLVSGTLTALSAGDLDSDGVYLLRYTGTVWLLDPGSGGSGGTITGSGTTGTLPKFTGATAIGDSIVTESAGVVTVGGGLTTTGRVNSGGATSTAPLKVGTTAPVTCTTGDGFFDSDATAGSNIYGCTATDTWTLQSGAPVAGPGIQVAGSTVSIDTAVTATHDSVQRGTAVSAVTTGTSTAYVLTLNPVATAYTPGMVIYPRFHTASGTNPTIDVSALGVKKIYRSNAGGAATQIATGALQAITYALRYDTTLDGGAGGFLTDIGYTAGGATSTTIQMPFAECDQAGAGVLRIGWSVTATVGASVNCAGTTPYTLGFGTFTNTADSQLQKNFWLPSNWSGGAITANLVIGENANGGTGNVEFEVTIVCMPSGAAFIDPSFGAATSTGAVAVSTSAGTANTTAYTSVSFTPSGCAAGNYARVRLLRDTTVASNYANPMNVLMFSLTVPTA